MKNVLIAGGATGIGRAALEAFREVGDAVFLADINQTTGAALADATGAHFLLADLGCAEAPQKVVTACLDALGGIDTLFVNAAVLASAPLGEWTREMWEKSLAVNLSAPFFLVQAAAEALRRSGNARDRKSVV